MSVIRKGDQASNDATQSTNELETLEQSQSCVESYNQEIPKSRTPYKLFSDKIAADIMTPCKCKSKCSEKLMGDPYIVKRVQHLRSAYFSCRQGNVRTTKTLELLRASISGSLERKRHNFEGVEICLDKWLELLAISKATYYRAVTLLKQDVYIMDNIRKTPCNNVKGLDAGGFIEVCLEKYGDFSPEKEKILLPPCVTRKFIFDEYLENPGPHLKIKHFYQIFKKQFSHRVSFAKSTNINPCDICLKVKNELHKITSDSEKKQLKDDLKIHLDRQSKERQDYYHKKQIAVTKPSAALSIIVDGMDQSKTSLPHFRGWTRPKASSLAVKTHITGTIVHGKGNHFFVDLLQWPHDPNLTVTCVLNSIGRYSDHLPPTLYIQCDNCGRENKNKYVLAFLSYLCLVGYVKEVFLSFLVKGHTHEDIDQRFSIISQHLRNVNAKTLPQLEQAIGNSFKERHHIETLSHIWDIKRWIGDYVNDIQNHSFPHQFWMFCDRPNHVALKSRMGCTDSWAPEDEMQQLELLALDSFGNQTSPSGIPEIVPPNYANKIDFEHLKTAIGKMHIHLSYEENRWWQNFISNPHIACRNRSRWPLLNLRKVHKIEDIPEVVEEERGNTCISQLVDDEGIVRKTFESFCTPTTIVTKQRKY